jgi:ubiquinone/menaquinone biosynthesis C-methylase UbiE
MLLVNGYAQYMPFVNQAFDQVVSTFPADFIFEPHCLYEIYRILKPGAKLIILPTAWVNSNRNNLLYKSVHSYNPPLNYFDALCEKLQACGFEVQRQQINLGASTLLLIIATKGFSPY